MIRAPRADHYLTVCATVDCATGDVVARAYAHARAHIRAHA